MYKYRIHYLLRQLSVDDYQISWKFFPNKLCISKNTWRDWIYIKENDVREIPQDSLKLIADFFEVELKDMYTNKSRNNMQKEFNQFKKQAL